MARYLCPKCGAEVGAQFWGLNRRAARAKVEVRVRWRSGRPRGWEVAALRELYPPWREKTAREIVRECVGPELSLGVFFALDAGYMQRRAKERDLELILVPT